MNILKYIRSPKCDFDDISKPLAITYDNMLLKHENTRTLIDTLESNNWEYSVIQINDVYENHSHKVIGYYEFLKLLPKDKIVVLMDSRDVFCCRDSYHFIENFNFLRHDIVISLEIWANDDMDVIKTRVPQCEPLVNYWKYKKVHSWPNRRYVNSGLIAGRVGELLKMFSFLDNNLNESQDDQVLSGIYMNNFPHNIHGDYDASILHSSTFAKGGGSVNFGVQGMDSPNYATLLGKGAFFLHFPSLSTRGQQFCYNMTKKMIVDEGFNLKNFNSLYNYTEDLFKSFNF